MALWSVLSIALGYAYVASRLELSPTADFYVHGVIFQVISYIIFVGPKLLVTLIVVLAAEFVLFRILGRRKPAG